MPYWAAKGPASSTSTLTIRTSLSLLNSSKTGESNEVEATIIKVDVDEAGPLAAQFGIQAVPTLILFKNGERVDTRMGYQNKNQLLAFINQ